MPRLYATIDVPLSYLDQELLDPIALSHEHIPHPTGQGAGIERWQRSVLSLHERTENLDNDTLTLTLADRGGLAHMYREGGVTLYADDPRREGVAISGQGVARSYLRTTKAWVESPGDGRVVEVPSGVEAATSLGIYTDPAADQLLLRSSFISGTTGLTLSGTGGGSTIAADTAAPLLFDTSITSNSLKIVKGAVADLYAQWPASQTIPASERLCFSIDHRDESGHALKWALQRSTDSNWWDDDVGTWSASIVWNALPLSPTGTIQRDRSDHINWPISAGTALLRVGYDGTATGKTGYVHHVQLEALPFQTGRMPQNASFVSPTRAETFLGFWESSGRRVFNEARGTLGFFLTVPWDWTDLEAGNTGTPGGFNVLLWTSQNQWPSTDHYWQGRVNGSLGVAGTRWEFAVKAGGAETVAYHTTKPARGTTYAVVWRWTSANEGELGLAANTLDVFLDGVKGTGASVGTRPTTIVNSMFNFNLFGARMKRLFSEARVWTDEEILAWSTS